MLQLREVRKNYITASETVEALKGVSLSFRKCEFVSILGPSGCGKTTLLNIIGGLDHYTSGDLIIGGRSTRLYNDRDWDVYRNHRIGFIFQSYNLIPHQTVLGNVELALTISGVSREERIERAKNALDRVGLKGQYYKRPNQLSGGQCQRVAIARALVNDPEILLADEPTGALDTQTSKQIMDLIREISGERLVIMVTHNPEIADAYSSRIIRLLDGRVVEDSNPFDVKDEEEETRLAAIAEEEALNESLAACKSERERKKVTKKKKERAKMSFFTAFMLSAKNLISKKGRTAMVGFAGSIGIIGIAMVLAFSAGIKGYVASMQDDMLSGNPITITKTAYDLKSITGLMNNIASNGKGEKESGKVYVNSIIENLVKMNTSIEDIVMENELTEQYVNYVTSMDESHYTAILLGYGIDMTTNIFTDFKHDAASAPQNISLHALLNVAKSVLGETDISEQADRITSLAPSLKQMPNNADYILSQYDLIGENSRLATEANEIMLVLNSDDELADILLARLGYFTQAEVLEIVNKALADADKSKNPDSTKTYDEALYKNKFTYDELLGKEFVWYPNNTVFTEGTPMFPGMPAMYKYNASSESFADSEDNGALPLKVVGILTPKDNVSYGSLTSGIYYTEALTQHVLEANENSKIECWLNTSAAKAILTSTFYNIPYTYSYSFDTNGNGTIEDGEIKRATASIGPDLTMSEMMMLSRIDTSDPEEMANALAKLDTDDMIERFVRKLGGNSLADSITIYPKSFDEKHEVTDYLDRWNEELKEGETHFEYTDKDGNVVRVAKDDKQVVTYTDAIELIVNIINTMIDIISYALIAFTSVSLVVSTVMIGIITYVSVVERIKEIGVIRSLGGRKKDVSHLFNAETFIIGLLTGVIGIGATYLISAIANAILKPLIGYASIAALPFSQALMLIALSVGLTLISGLIPASSAAKQDPVVALRTE